MDLSLLLAIALIVGLFFWLKRSRGQVRFRNNQHLAAKPGPTQRVRGQTQRQLLRLVGGNKAVAERLVGQVQLRYPNHSQQWCWEKAIYDIQRDRRS